MTIAARSYATNNGQSCDGTETCDSIFGCQSNAAPCPPNLCDEGTDACTNWQSAVDCDDGIPCTFDQCVNAVCSNTAALYGNTSGVQETCGPDAQVDLLDILGVLDAFQGIFAAGCEEHNIDIGGTCGGDGGIDLTDILAVLDAFQGTSDCCP